MLKKVVLWILVILTCCMIFNFSAKVAKKSDEQSKQITNKVEKIITEVTNKEPSEAKLDKLDRIIRKQGHFIEFAILGIFSFMLVRCYNFSLKKGLLITLLFLFFYACTDEIHQVFVDGRSGNVKDLIIDFLGGLTGTVLVLLSELKKMSRKAQI